MIKCINSLMKFCGGELYTCRGNLLRIYNRIGECMFEMWEDEYINNVDVKEVFESIREMERKRIILENAWLLF